MAEEIGPLEFRDLGVPPNPQGSATQLLGRIPFGAIIGGPLVAAIRAQSIAAGETLKYIFDVLYGEGSHGSNPGKGEALTVEFRFTKEVTGGTSETFTLDVPVITLVPIPYIQIDTMTINFKAALNATSSATNTTTNTLSENAGLSGHIDAFFVDTDFSGSYSSKQSSTATQQSKYSVEYTLDVFVHATGEDMPAGTAKVLNILTDAVKADIKQSAHGS